MEIFTDTEKRILERTDKSYKYIARDRDGCLYIYNTKPYKDENCGFLVLVQNLVMDIYLIGAFLTFFLKMLHGKNSPIQYRDSGLLTPKEREYLKFVFRPFANYIKYVRKLSTNNNEYIGVYIYKGYKDALMLFPDFEKGTMYKGMKPETKYTLKELGIEYDE